MTKGISIRDTVKKIDDVLLITMENKPDYPLTLKAFKKIMMVDPAGPIITSERICRERYRTFQEIGIINETGRINMDLFTRILNDEAIL